MISLMIFALRSQHRHGPRPKEKSPWSMSGSIPECSREIFREKRGL